MSRMAVFPVSKERINHNRPVPMGAVKIYAQNCLQAPAE